MKLNTITTTSNNNIATSNVKYPTPPQWIRLPKPGQYETNTGLTRSVLTRLCVEGKIKSISLRDDGKARGCRLVNLQSLIDHLELLENTQNNSTETFK
jgi:hypothetical protein